MYNWLKDPTHIGMIVFLAILAVIVAIVLLCTAPAKADLPAETHGEQEPTSEAVEVEAMIRHLVAIAPRHPLNRADYREKLAGRLAAGAIEYGISVALVTAMAYRESSFRWDVIGPGGERGVMQVHPKTIRRFKCDMDTIEGQIDCGCKVLAWHHDRCESDWRAALAAYGSRRAQCNPKPGSKLRGMVDDRFALADELRMVAQKRK